MMTRTATSSNSSSFTLSALLEVSKKESKSPRSRETPARPPATTRVLGLNAIRCRGVRIEPFGRCLGEGSAMISEKQANESTSDDLSDECLRPDVPRRQTLLSRAQVLAVLGPLLISLEGVDP